ncbi:unnamed protein product [Caenorhabditis bovis]|uniref:Uncharacterized protein n=1 Tax=Caenorhabditis bovis TaxID=2654633 RepID=A0A8S1F420_9PELO|nr:unnamed protein product [Caenorhabditis bovis]
MARHTSTPRKMATVMNVSSPKLSRITRVSPRKPRAATTMTETAHLRAMSRTIKKQTAEILRELGKSNVTFRAEAIEALTEVVASRPLLRPTTAFDASSGFVEKLLKIAGLAAAHAGRKTLQIADLQFALHIEVIQQSP